MNLKNIINGIENTDPAEYEKVSGRRDALKNIGSIVAAAAIPFGAATLFANKAQAKTTANTLVDALNVILEQEYLEYAYIRIGNNTGALIPANDQPGFKNIEAHKKALINFLNVTISTGLGGTPFVPKHYTDSTTQPPFVPAAYDFTASGTYATVFSDYTMFLIIGQIITDTGVHCIKGQIDAFITNDTKSLLTQIFQVQATKARHAAYIRLVRRLAGAPEYPAPWITNNIPPTLQLQTYYENENNVTQKGVIVTTMPDTYGPLGNVPEPSATAAFDEPYDLTKITALMSPFKTA